MSSILDAAFVKLGRLSGRLYDVQDNLLALIRLLRAYVRREYADVSPRAVVAVLASVLYFVNPFDLITDFIPFIGFLDDIAVIGYVVAVFRDEIDKFVEWEHANRMERANEQHIH